METAALRERRAALRRRVLRRRRAALAGVVLAAVALAAFLMTRGGDTRSAGTGSAASRPAATAAPVTPGAQPHAKPPVPAKVPMHRAPREAVPILMYHVIGYRQPSTPNPSLWVAPADFIAQVLAMKRAGYHGVTLQQVWDAWHAHGKLPSKPVVLSFDDGYLGQVLHALPALKHVGWPGVLNLKLGNLADMGGTKAIKRMIHAGWEVDSHTITHPDLTTVDAARLKVELVDSRARITRYFGVPANFFCYPSGRYDATVVAAVKSAGYLAATTVQPGWSRPSDNPFELSRVRVDGGMTPTEVLQRIRDERSAQAAA